MKSFFSIILVLFSLTTKPAAAQEAARCDVFTTYGTAKGAKVDIFKSTFSFVPNFNSSNFPGTPPDLANGLVEFENGYELSYRFWTSQLVDDVTMKPSVSFIQLYARLQKRSAGKAVLLDEFLINQEPDSSGSIQFSTEFTDRLTVSRWLNSAGFNFSIPGHVELSEALRKGMAKDIPAGEQQPYSWRLHCAFR